MTMVLFALSSRVSPRFWLLLCLRRRLLLIDSPWRILEYDGRGVVMAIFGASLVVNSLWKNPYGEWHAGYKFVYEPFTETLTSHLKKERRKKWDERHQESIAEETH
ncbi:tripeptidyl-peptidase 2 isoform X2 [Vitis vinifera]|uniref:tripeptidyl-peptidase 2 isoform X2 n=1 Tax=Vitis vinifera TaxID=29760 RepID=UPI00023B299D|nr:tripeptidyl-peptidase 2 isoform X2 [Vitis vinifera]|eukprot:XP_003634103.1 PREDICTED: tripeptidyl-peptidase 2 isoform X2 [Vitis vinifera]